MAGTWDEWRNHVLIELEGLNGEIEKLSKQIEDMRKENVANKVDIRELNIKSSIWGLLGGILAGVGTLLIAYFSNKGG